MCWDVFLDYLKALGIMAVILFGSALILFITVSLYKAILSPPEPTVVVEYIADPHYCYEWAQREFEKMGC